jgi:hypothetical protein
VRPGDAELARITGARAPSGGAVPAATAAHRPTGAAPQRRRRSR